MTTQPSNRIYIAIDLKSFYASVECVDRGLDPLSARLVVADESRTDKTICLAVSPALKSFGVPGRPRLFEVKQQMRKVNAARRDSPVDFLIAPPRMARYIACSAQIYGIYLRYIAPEDIHVYSIDEVFIDVTPYLATYRLSPRDLAMKMIREVLAETGITATVGIGTNLYLAKVAMDIVAKRMAPDADGVRIAELDEASYRRELWGHMPLTDFWRVGRGTARKLASYGILTMGQLARASLRYEAHLYKLFGVGAELLIDHAWGIEPCTMEAVKAYRPASNSLSSGQVLAEPYTWAKARVVTLEMADALALSLLDKRLVSNRLTLTVGYDVANLTDPAICAAYQGEVVTDHYGRLKPRHTHGTLRLELPTSSMRTLGEAAAQLYDRVANPLLLVRRLTLCVADVTDEAEAERQRRNRPVTLSLFDDHDAQLRALAEKERSEQRERQMQEAMLAIKKRFGKNAILTGLNFADGATAKERNTQIGGHKA